MVLFGVGTPSTWPHAFNRAYLPNKAAYLSRIMKALQKRGASEALDDILKVARRRVYASPDRIDALINEP